MQRGAEGWHGTGKGDQHDVVGGKAKSLKLDSGRPQIER